MKMLDLFSSDAELEVDVDGRTELVKMADELLNECKHRKKKMEHEALSKSTQQKSTHSPVKLSINLKTVCFEYVVDCSF